MIKNLYTNAVDKIKISDSAINSAVELARTQAEKNRTINLDSHRKSKKAVRVIAASLAAVIALSGGVFAMFSNSGTNNGFVITADAAEINNNAFTQIATCEQSFSSGWSSKDYDEEFNLLLKCEGENIKTITYTACGNSYLHINSHKNEFVDCKPSEYLNFRVEDNYSSVTVDYNNQITAIEPNYNVVEYPVYTPLSMDFFITDENSEKAAEVLKLHQYYTMHALGGNPNYDDRIRQLFDEADAYGFDYKNFDSEAMFTELYNMLFDNASLDVTVTYENGETETKTIIFGYEFIGDQLPDYCDAKNTDLLAITAKLA